MKNTEPIKRPSRRLHISEPFRATRERVKSLSFLKNYQPDYQPDGHPILVIPGFMASDRSTEPMVKLFNRIGFTAYNWGYGRNYGEIENLKLLSERLDIIFEKHQQKISVIGWSLGGVYARELAKEKTHMVRQVITLGSPFAGITEPNNATWFFEWVNGKRFKEIHNEWIERLPEPAPVPTSALYSKEDGIVPWQVCMEKMEDEIHENIEIRGSHFGMGINAGTLKVIIDRLQYSEENWMKYLSSEKLKIKK